MEDPNKLLASEIIPKVFALEEHIRVCRLLMSTSQTLDTTFHQHFDMAHHLSEELSKQNFTILPPAMCNRSNQLISDLIILSSELGLWQPVNNQVKTYYDNMFPSTKDRNAVVKTLQPDELVASTEQVRYDSDGKPISVEELQRNVEDLKGMYGALTVETDQQRERVEGIENAIERTTANNELAELEVKKARTWGEMLRANKLLVGAITFVSTAAVIVPAAVYVLLKNKQKEPFEDPI